jgi:hypothetical protein
MPKPAGRCTDLWKDDELTVTIGSSSRIRVLAFPCSPGGGVPGLMQFLRAEGLSVVARGEQGGQVLVGQAMRLGHRPGD